MLSWFFWTSDRKFPCPDAVDNFTHSRTIFSTNSRATTQMTCNVWLGNCVQPCECAFAAHDRGEARSGVHQSRAALPTASLPRVQPRTRLPPVLRCQNAGWTGTMATIREVFFRLTGTARRKGAYEGLEVLPRAEPLCCFLGD